MGEDSWTLPGEPATGWEGQTCPQGSWACDPGSGAYSQGGGGQRSAKLEPSGRAPLQRRLRWVIPKAVLF